MRLSLNPCSTGITFLTQPVCYLPVAADGLNPCSTGITFLTKENLKKMLEIVVSLNPCSTGITFLTRRICTDGHSYVMVLILVLLE